MKFFKKTASQWRKIQVAVVGVEALEFDRLAFQMACDFADHFGVKLYFGRYAGVGTPYVEIKAQVTLPDDQIVEFLRTMDAVGSVKIEPFDGQPEFAQAFELARQLHGKGDAQVGEVVHFLMNMLGYSYRQEIHQYLDMVAKIVDSLQHAAAQAQERP